jgi:hypothetical protein
MINSAPFGHAWQAIIGNADTGHLPVDYSRGQRPRPKAMQQCFASERRVEPPNAGAAFEIN